mmetsp:Transcript_84209/g.195797  ORF Transcript_84209/g.195797 Transcript_84209/m.195797 type:complete len:900 (-) Transcript_84209:76-2775(-)
MMAKYSRIISGLVQRCQRAVKVVRGLYKDSPVVFFVILAILFILVSIVALFSACVNRLVGGRGTILVDLTLVWLFATFVARVLMFPGSFKLFQRNTEASFRTEMSRQYAHYLRQLWTFLRHAAKQSESMLRGVTADGVYRGCTVIETLTTSFTMQEQQHEVRLSKEQRLMLSMAQEVGHWLAGAKINRLGGGQAGAGVQLPLIDWLRQQASGFGDCSVQPHSALSSVELLGSREEAAHSIEQIEQLLGILDELRYQKKSIIGNTLRFFQVPTVGSLNQLRTELQMRHKGHRCWVHTSSGRRLDAMYIPCSGQAGGEDEAGHEDSPLQKSSKQPLSFAGPTLIWCNPNAAYYETMVYQPAWLNFWLSRGISLFFFNYTGYGRSTGKPSPSRIAEDAESVIRFLQNRGATQIGIYGRSIGGVAACHLARHHPELVKLLIADRTMSTLEGAAKYMYGSWAAKSLRVTFMMADNVEHFWEVRAHKLLVVDPKDTMILDLAALRTAVALRAVERMSPQERLPLDDEALQRLEEVWRFFNLIFAICESDDDMAFDGTLGQETSRPARQPNFAREDRTDCRVKVGDSNNTSNAPGSERLLSAQWLEENAGLVRSSMMLLVDQVRSALDIVGEHLEGGGVTLNDVFADNPNDARWALKSMLANLQVWGTLGDQREEGELAVDPQAVSGGAQPYALGVTDSDIEYFLRKDGDGDYMPPRATPQRLEELGRVLQPEMITTYHRRLARARVAQIRKEFRRRFGGLQHAFTHIGSNPGSGSDAQATELVERLFRTVLHHLGEVESFVSTLSRFFKSVDLAAPYSRQELALQQEPAAPLSDSSDEKFFDASVDAKVGTAASAKPQPSIDHSMAGYIMHIDCGHNGLMDDVDMRQLSLHLRAAHFGNDAPRLS